jgi:hypothetical protein
VQPPFSLQFPSTISVYGTYLLAYDRFQKMVRNTVVMIMMATAELDHSAPATVLNEPGFLPHQEFTGCISADVAGKCVQVIGTGNATEESTFFSLWLQNENRNDAGKV